MSKIKIFIISLILSCAVTAVIVPKIIEYSRQITGQEWFAKQESYVEDFGEYADSMDDVYALFFSGSISEEDFLNHLDVFSAELKIMKTAYDQELKEHPVRIGTHTYSTKKGCEAVEECFDIFEDILSMSYNNYEHTGVLGYKYIAAQDRITDALGTYMAAKESIENGEE